MAEEQKIEERFRYIGFDVYPSKAKKIFKDQAEEQLYLDQLKKKKKELQSFERDYSLVYLPSFAQTDKMVLTVFSILLTASFFLPWFSFTWANRSYSFSALTSLLNLTQIGDFLALGGTNALVTVILMALFMILSFLLGLANLLSLFTKAKDQEKYWKRLKKLARIGYLPILIWLAVLIISIVGFNTPIWDLIGVNKLGEKFNIINLIRLSSFGTWLAFGSLVVNSSIAGEI